MAKPIMLEIAAASREQEMWERRFRVLYAQHPIWRTADNDGSWGLRDFLRYAGEVCGFTPDRNRQAKTENTGSTEGESGLPEGSFKP